MTLNMREIVGVTVAVGLLAATAVGQEVYHDAQDHWSIMVPKGWKVAPEEVRLRVQEAASKVAPDQAPVYTVMLTPDPPGATGYPYVLIQRIVAPMWRATVDEIAQTLAETPVAEVERGAESRTGEGVRIEPQQFDRERMRLVTRSTVDLGASGTVRGLTVGFVGKNGIIQVCAYAQQQGANEAGPMFDSIISSFVYDAGSEYSPPAVVSGASRGRSLWPMVVGVVVVVAAVGGIVVNLKKRSRGVA